MEMWLFWFLLGVLLVAVEVMVAFTLYAGAVSLGAFPAAIVAALGASLEIQVAVFAVGAALSLLLLRPLARKHLVTPPAIRTGADALVGALATVVEPVDDDSGQVKIRGGDVWSARTARPGERFKKGAEVSIQAVRGVTVVIGAPGESPQVDAEGAEAG
jgi:membrane protein implicated in regulation of membrane protease activity